MKRKAIILAAVALALPFAANAQTDYDTFYGYIPANTNPLPLATDGTALVYGTFNSGDSAVYVIDDVMDAILHVFDEDADPVGEQIDSHIFPMTRGYQGAQITADGQTIYTSGDDNVVEALIRKFDLVGGSWVQDTNFDSSGVTQRILGIALIGDVIAAQQFNNIYYVDAATGAQVGSPVSLGGINYHREPVFNSDDNVIYPLQNGDSSPIMVAGYVSGVSTETGGGTWNASTLIPDGAWDTQFGGGTQHGYYDAANGQLITLDTAADAATRRVRVWDVSNNGTTLTLNHSVDTGALVPDDPDTFEHARGLNDAAVIGDFLFVSSSADDRIYVFSKGIEPPPVTSVRQWELY